MEELQAWMHDGGEVIKKRDDVELVDTDPQLLNMIEEMKPFLPIMYSSTVTLVIHYVSSLA